MYIYKEDWKTYKSGNDIADKMTSSPQAYANIIETKAGKLKKLGKITVLDNQNNIISTNLYREGRNKAETQIRDKYLGYAKRAAVLKHSNSDIKASIEVLDKRRGGRKTAIKCWAFKARN